MEGEGKAVMEVQGKVVKKGKAVMEGKGKGKDLGHTVEVHMHDSLV